MNEYLQENIIHTKADLLVNAANGQGYMGGFVGRYICLPGVAESIHYADPSIERISKKECKKRKVLRGEIFHTESGNLDFPKGIVHAVTMQKPGQRSDLETVEVCLLNIIKYCYENNVKTVAIPLLGTGTGRLDKKKVSYLYETLLGPLDTVFKIVSK